MLFPSQHEGPQKKECPWSPASWKSTIWKSSIRRLEQAFAKCNIEDLGLHTMDDEKWEMAVLCILAGLGSAVFSCCPQDSMDRYSFMPATEA